MTTACALDLLRRGVVDVINDAELRARLATGRPLVVKAGFDPTAPDLHLGHTVLLRKLRHFQDLGHKVIFLIGDATGLVGDPTGQSATRRPLSWEEVRANAATYQQQVKRLLLADAKHFEVRYNSEWFLGRSPQMRTTGLEAFDFFRFVQLASHVTVARLIERDDFSKRLKAGKPVSFLELFYPLMQAYDSLKIAEQHGSCDVELGGTDQTFNLLMGRQLLEAYGKPPQVVMTMPLLEGTDGVAKMSKSLGNHIGIQDAAGEMFGKIMSIPDTLIVKYFTLLTDVDAARLKELEQSLAARSVNPRDAKADLGAELVRMYHGEEAAAKARQEFTRIFSKKEQPKDMPAAALPAGEPVDLLELLVAAGLAKTKNEARRLLKQGSVKLNGAKVTGTTLPRAQLSGGTLQVGSRYFRRLVG